MSLGRPHFLIGHGTLGLRPGAGRRVLLTLLVGALAGCAGSGHFKVAKDKGEVVEAEGWSPLDPQDLLGSKQRSLAEAQKKAVEEVVGVYISAKTRVAQAVDVDQNILAKVGGYIQRYDVLWEKQEDGFYKTRIRALVLYKKVGEDLKSLGLMRPGAPPGNPRIVVILNTRGPYSEATDGRSAGAVRRALLERGFSVIDRNDPMAYGNRKSTDAATAASVGRDMGADIVVRGEAEVHALEDVHLGGFYSYRARVQLEAAKPATGEVLSRKVQESSGLDPSPDIAAAKALENAGMLAGDAMASDLAEGLKSQINVSLVVLGAGDLGKVQRLAEDIRLLPGVSGVTLSEYRKEGADLAVVTEEMAGDELAACLLRMKKYSFTVRTVTPYAVEVVLAQ